MNRRYFSSSLRAAAAAVALISTAVPALSQSVRPIIAEYRSRARGRFEVINTTSRPMAVVLQAQSFTPKPDGSIEYRPLDPELRLRLSQMSFRIPPGQRYYVFYEAEAEVRPAWFVVYASMGALPRPASGLDVRVDLPHVVYLLSKRELRREDVRVAGLVFNSPSRKLLMRVENLAAHFGRVLQCEAFSGKKKATGSGFALFPNAAREVEIPWPYPEPPEKVVLRFRNFTFEQKFAGGEALQAVAP